MSNDALVGVGPDTQAEMPTHELMSWLTDQERDRFVLLQETFETGGWKLLVDYASAKVVQHGVDGSNASTWEKVLENRGARMAWEQVSKLADEFMNAFEHAAQAAQAEAAAGSDDPE